jgi:cellulose synthase/poly-beta-1,6-N-acetylglucosamine synthase-like glycosyltransferase
MPDLTTWIYILFWLAAGIVFYTYLGYGLLLFALVSIKQIIHKSSKKATASADLPAVTILIAAFNEEQYIRQKIINCLEVDYPTEKLEVLVVTDGSNDRTNEIIRGYPQVKLLYKPEREGKSAAISRGMKQVKNPITIFTDANTIINPEAVKILVQPFRDPTVGIVSGEKRILQKANDSANSAGEGFYWKYESFLKMLDAELYSVVGAAGELYAIRTPLFHNIPQDIIIEDFYLTLSINAKGFRTVYCKEAFAAETASADVHEELKRKIRISAGGLQAVGRLSRLLIPWPHPVLTFQYISHRVLRWTLAPLSLAIIFLTNIYLAWMEIPFFQVVLILQLGFYLAGSVGYLLAARKLKFKLLFIPYYFLMMNYAVYIGFWGLIKGKQTSIWEKANRQPMF